MTPLYNAGIHLYRAAARIAAMRSRKVATMIGGQRETLERLRAERKRIAPEGYDLWVHAASLGEFEQGRPLMERFRREHPEARILLSFFSPSGYEVRKNYPVADTIVYLPFDTPSAARAFIEAAAPKCAVFVKYEFWGNYITRLRKLGIPVYIISAIFRPGQIFFRPWGGDFRRILRSYDRLFVQDDNSGRLLHGIGIDNVTVAGDTRFDRVTDIMAARKELPEVEAFCEGSPFTLVIGSSWQPDEDVYIDWLHAHPEVKTISDPAPVRYLIVDSFGLLSSLYRFADVAIIGGGFGAGIHNLNEAAVYGIPVLFGPRHGKFKEASDLIAKGGGFEMADAPSGRAILDSLLADKEMRSRAGQAAGDYIRASIGATDKIYNAIFAHHT